MDLEAHDEHLTQRLPAIQGDGASSQYGMAANHEIQNTMVNIDEGGRSLVELYVETNMALSMAAMNNAPMFFDNVLNIPFDANGTNAEIRRLQAEIDAMYDDPSAQFSHATSSLLSSEGSTSSTGSSGEICLMTDFDTEYDLVLLPPEPNETPIGEDQSQNNISKKGKEPMKESVMWSSMLAPVCEGMVGRTDGGARFTQTFHMDSKMA